MTLVVNASVVVKWVLPEPDGQITPLLTADARFAAVVDAAYPSVVRRL